MMDRAVKLIREQPITILLCLAAALPLLAPGDAYFIADGPEVIRNAYLANENGTLVKHGLMGSLGIYYGPLPTWFYQAMLVLTHNLVAIVFWKYLIATASLIAALWWLGRSLKLTIWPAALSAISPFVLILHRSLWDQGFMVSQGAWLVLAYVHFIQTRRKRWLALAAFLCLTLIYTQVKTIFIVGGAGLALVILHWRLILEYWKAALLTLGTGAVACLPYGYYIAHNMVNAPTFKEEGPSGLIACLATIRAWSFVGFADDTFPSMRSEHFYLPQPLHTALIALSGLIIVSSIIGLYRGILLIRNKDEAMTCRRFCVVLSLITMLMQVGLFVGIGKAFYIHYMTAVWFPYFYFAWEGIHWLWSRKWGVWLSGIYLTSQLVLWPLTLIFIHQMGGSREDTYGALLSNQIVIVRDAVSKPPHSMSMNVSNYLKFPHTYSILTYMEMKKLQTTPAKDSKTHGIVDYRDPDNPDSGWLIFRRVPIETPPP